MGFRIMHNIGAMNANRNLGRSEGWMAKSLQRLSSGLRINSAADDAAGLGASQRMRAEIASLKVATRNATEATSLLQVAEGGMEQIGDILQRLKELATQAASGNAGIDRDKIHAEGEDLMAEVDRIASFVEYNDVGLLDGTYHALTVNAANDWTTANGIVNIDVNAASAADTLTGTVVAGTNSVTLASANLGISQTVTYTDVNAGETAIMDFTAIGVKIKYNGTFAGGAGTGETAIEAGTADIVTGTAGDALIQIGHKGTSDTNHRLGFQLGDMRSTALNDGAALTVDLSTSAGAQAALDDIQTAVDYVSTQRSEVGTLVNRFGYAVANLNISVENKQSSESVLRDADMAMEMTDFTRNQILVQAGTSMLAQANIMPQSVLSLLG